MIKIISTGHLGKDVVQGQSNGKTVLNFTVAHTKKIKLANGQVKDETTWMECQWWTERLAIAPYLKKGTHVLIEGTPIVRSWKTNEGEARASLIVRIEKVELLGSKPPGDNQSNAGGSPGPSGGFEPIGEADDLPF